MNELTPNLGILPDDRPPINGCGGRSSPIVCSKLKPVLFRYEVRKNMKLVVKFGEETSNRSTPIAIKKSFNISW